MDSLEKKYYKISEVAEITGIPASTLRYWEDQFTVIKPRRNDRGSRFYTSADIEKIRMIYYLVKEKGLKLAAAQEQIRRNHSGVSRRFQAIERLQGVKAQLQSVLASLDSMM